MSRDIPAELVAAAQRLNDTFLMLLDYWRADPARPYRFAADRRDPEAQAIADLRAIGLVEVHYSGHDVPCCLPAREVRA